LGLYNIKNVIQHMHGTIEVESRVGRGSTFTITFPQGTAAEDRSRPS
jgi:signal transduction histidine kinase